jgi:hypothetical protein
MSKIDPRKNHIHRYILREQGPSKRLIYRCEHKDGACGHYLPAMEAIGAKTICWVCGETCTIPKERPSRLVKRPHCLTCTKVYNRADVKAKPEVDLKKLSEMSIEDLLGNDFSLVGGKKKDED